MNLESYRNHLRQKPTRFGTVRTDATINRDISCLHHMFSKAVEWEMIEKSPFDKGKSLLVKENNQRLRYLEENEIDSLLKECTPPIRDIVECALNTGMRRGEILNLKWNQIRNGFIYLKKTKTQNPREIPINDTLDKMFKRIKSEQNPSENNVVGLDGKPVKAVKSKYVFSKKGKPYTYITNTFNTAVRRAGIEDFRFHDLRHTFASQLLMMGGSLKDVQELLGHKTMTMTLRYAHLSQEHKRKAVNLLNGLTASKKDDCHKTGTTENAVASYN
jgi:integrase